MDLKLKQTKNEITREFIKKELSFYNKADIRSGLLLGIVLALLSVPLVCLCAFLIDHLVLRIVFSCLCAFFPFGVFSLSFIYQLIRALGEKKMINGDQFEITTRKVLSMDENGHGTFMAGIAAGGTDAENDFLGIAGDAEIAVVKLKEAKQHLKDYFRSLSTQKNSNSSGKSI